LIENVSGLKNIFGAEFEKIAKNKSFWLKIFLAHQN
jgi:hypothetical protein